MASHVQKEKQNIKKNVLKEYDYEIAAMKHCCCNFHSNKEQCLKQGLNVKEIKDLNLFISNKVDEMFESHERDLHTMSDVEDILISSSNESIISITSADTSDNEDCKPKAKM
eukprot:6412683-Ditylum_brightwellii.AAC.1